MHDAVGDDVSPSMKNGGVSSHMSSSHQQSNKKIRKRKRIMDGTLSSNRDTESRASGFYSIARGSQAKKSIRGKGKRSLSLAQNNETLINKI
jgi:hypothetical protein